MPVIIRNAVLEERDRDIVIRGVIAPESLKDIKMDDYQREELAGNKHAELMGSLANGHRIPDITLCMRGQRVSSQKNADGSEDFILLDDTYCPEGRQRHWAMVDYLARCKDNPTLRQPSPLGAKAFLNTNREIELELFESQDKATGIAPSIFLRNRRDKHFGIATVYGLSESDRDFPFFHRICWRQRRKSGDLLTGMVLLRYVTNLYGGSTGDWRALMRKSDVDYALVGGELYRKNAKTFASVLDECWGIRTLSKNDSNALHLKWSFVYALGAIFAEHKNFWRGNELYVAAAHKKKLTSFPLTHPEVARLCAGDAVNQDLIYDRLVRHMNKGVAEENKLHLKPKEE